MIKNKKIISIVLFIILFLFYLFYKVGLIIYPLLWVFGLVLAIYLGKIIISRNREEKSSSTILILILEISILISLLNPTSLYFLYGNFRITSGILTDSVIIKRGDYLSKCETKKMDCNISNCEYENTRNCVCYNCLSNFNFEDCSQCYMPATQEVFCAENKCNIPNFP